MLLKNRKGEMESRRQKVNYSSYEDIKLRKGDNNENIS